MARDSFEVRQIELEAKAIRADREQSLTFLLAGLAAFYIAVRFGATKQLDALGEHASDFAEIGLVSFAILLLRPKPSIQAIKNPVTLFTAAAAAVAGFIVLKFARLANISVPFDVHDRQTVVMLVLVAPILEELIFRFMLFKPIERIWSARAAMFATAALFSYSHLHAIWFVPAEYDKFILYQTAYTLPLGLACSWMMKRQNSLLSSMLVHGAFNAAFFLAFWV